MGSFNYKNKSTLTILDVPLLCCTFDKLEDLPGFKREIQKGEVAPNRSQANEYGTKYSDTLTFEIAIIKSDSSSFTEEEQRKINRWLTSSQFSQFAEFTSCTNKKTTYKGLFTDVRWKVSGIGIIGAVCEFTCNSMYSWSVFSQSFNGPGTYRITADSDEEESYLYPVMTVTSNTSSDIEVCNITDNNHKMQIHANANLPMRFDCRYCIPSAATTNNIISYADLGWADVGNIYWLRFLPGDNELKITGDAQVTISFKCPHKIMGGWCNLL